MIKLLDFCVGISFLAIWAIISFFSLKFIFAHSVFVVYDPCLFSLLLIGLCFLELKKNK